MGYGKGGYGKRGYGTLSHGGYTDSGDGNTLTVSEQQQATINAAYIAAGGHGPDEIVLVPGYLQVVGSAARYATYHTGMGGSSADGQNLPEDIDILVRDAEPEKHWHETLWLRLREMLDPQKKGVDIHQVYNPQGPAGDEAIPMYDLVLRRRQTDT